MRLLNTAVIRLTLVFILGIVAGFHFKLPLDILIPLASGSSLLFLFSLIRAHQLLLQDGIFGTACLALFFCIGMTVVELHSPKNQPNHYSNLVLPSEGTYLLTITQSFKSNNYSDLWVAEVRQVNGKKSHGKILLVLPKQCFELKADQLLAVTGQPETIPENLNPQRFSYKNFLANKGILYRLRPSEKAILQIQQNVKTLRGAAENLREHIIAELKTRPLGPEELAITQALLLGQRGEISTTTEEQYASAGVIHILAVSGLHIGIILLLFNILLSPLNQLKYGKPIKLLLLLSLLWAYALLAGLSPSIIRAATMFSFLAIGIQLQRRTAILNSLFLSLLFLLLLNPLFIYEAGFQLSYAAVIAIVLLQPHLYSLLSPPGWWLDNLWKIFTVSSAAQLGVLPLSLYYFHQFPGLFFLSNLAILPFLGLLLGLGFTVILLALADLLPEVLSRTFNFLIESLNRFVGWIAKQENFAFTEISFSLPDLLVSYILIASIIFYANRRTYQSFRLLLGAIILLQLTIISQRMLPFPDEFIVFHKTRHTIIGKQQKGVLEIAHNAPEPVEALGIIKNLKLENQIRKTTTKNLENLYSIPNGLLLVVDSSGIYDLNGLKPDGILLTQSPEINLERLLEKLKPNEVIADGSNYLSNVRRWERTCRKNKIPFHYTGEKGAWRKKN